MGPSPEVASLCFTTSPVGAPISQMRKRIHKGCVRGRVVLGQEVAGPCESDVHVPSQGYPAALDCRDSRQAQALPVLFSFYSWVN